MKSPPSYLALVPAAGETFTRPRRRRRSVSEPLSFKEAIDLLSQAVDVQMLAARLKTAVHQDDRLVAKALADRASIEADYLCKSLGRLVKRHENVKS